MSLGNPLDPSSIAGYESIIKEEFSAVEDLFTDSVVSSVRDESESWARDEDLMEVPSTQDLEELMDSPDVIVPDLFQDLADLEGAAGIFEDEVKEELGLFLDEEDGLRSDIMWSSACLNEENGTGCGSSGSLSGASKRPRRDSTLSLMECAQSLFREFELSGFPFMDTPLPSSEDDDEEEIDVVSYERANQNTRIFSTGTNSTSNHVSTPGNPRHRSSGRSLLKSQQPVLDHGWGDHLYHSVMEPPARSTPMGILTPTESEDENESPSLLVKPLDSIINKHSSALPTPKDISNNSHNNNNNVKFKFRMKFKSSSSTNGSANSSNTSNSSEQSLHRPSVKRKSASNNAYCPPPTPTKSSSPLTTTIRTASKRSAGGGITANSTSSSSCSSDNSGSRHSVNEAKCREVRDLHNSMERQRRVDLRNNFDQLKVVVPELKDAEKASKLNILNKSAEYCKLLTSSDNRLRKEKESLLSRNAALSQRLSQLKSLVDRKYNQQRLSEKRAAASNNTTHYSAASSSSTILLPQPIRTLA